MKEIFNLDFSSKEDGEIKLVSNVLQDLYARDKGSYYQVRCPICGEREAYVYKRSLNDIKEKRASTLLVRCSRLNNCGQVSRIPNVAWDEDALKDLEVDEASEKKRYPKKDVLERTTYLMNLNEYLHGWNDFAPWRGLSKSTLIDNGICYLDKRVFPQGWLTWLEQRTPSVPKETLVKKKLYASRDIVIPLKNEQGIVDRVLLRSSWDKDVFPKEVTFKMTSESIPIWNRKDALNANGKILFITEGVPDALSIKEADRYANVVALPGVGQWKHFVRYTKQYNLHYRRVIICFDADKAGQTATDGLARSLKTQMNIDTETFDLHEYKDLNDFLLGNRQSFISSVKAYSGHDTSEFRLSFKSHSHCLEKSNEKKKRRK